MFSFEGNFRTSPTVSLGGKSKESATGSKLIEKAKSERLKRELARKRLKSSLVLQSSVRSFLVRKKVKAEFREKFDNEKDQLLKESRLLDATRLLCFFYESKIDSDRLVWLCQKLLLLANEQKCWSSTYLLSQVLVLCCRSLMNDTKTQAAIQLRMFETFTTSKFWTKTNDDNKNEKTLFDQLLLWERLVEHDFFKIVMQIFAKKVPQDIEFPEEDDEGIEIRSTRYVPPHLILADSLLGILKQPLKFIWQISLNDRASTLSEDMETKMCKIKELIFGRFSLDVLSDHLNLQTYNFILPSLKQEKDFPKEHLLRYITDALSQTTSLRIKLFPSVYLLASFIRFFDKFTEANSTDVLVCLRWLVPTLPEVCRGELVDSDDEEEESMEVSMDISEQSVSYSELLSKTYALVNSKQFINCCVKRKQYAKENIAALCEIAHHFLSKLRYTVHTTRMLYTLAFSSSFLKNLWNSILNLKTDKINSMQSQYSIQAVVSGGHMSAQSVIDFDAQLITFAALYSHNLLSLHDVDFYQSDSTSKIGSSFSLNELAIIVRTLRDICLSLTRRIFPEWRSPEYDVKELYHLLSTGQPLKQTRSIHSSSGLSIPSAAHLFKMCSRLLNQLHTRHTRRPFVKDDAWLSAMMGNDNPKYLISNWRRRRMPKNNIAAHMADPSDEDLPMSVVEARQLLTLTCLPFSVPFTTRVSIFTSMLTQDRNSRESARDALFHDAGFADTSTVIRVTVRRDYLYEDAFNDFSMTNAPDLRSVLRVTFVNPAGAEEAGYGEGVTREFMQQLAKTAFQPHRGLFQVTEDSTLCPNPHADKILENSNEHFSFLGRILGKLLYEGMQIEIRFASFFLCKLLRHRNVDVDINHLQSLDPDVYKNLMLLRSYDGDVTNLGLNFTVVDDNFGQKKVTELVPGGQDIMVDNDNRVRYIHLLANYKLNVQMKSACDAFRKGLASVVPLDWLRMFDHRELQTLISGAEIEIDVNDMKVNAAYSGGYKADDPTIQLFWDLLETFSEEEKRKLLLFVTSCSRPPFLGFKEMHPPFCVHNGGGSDRLPTSSTCLNLLRLPRYTDVKTMKEKLLYCIESESGFELS